MDSGLLCSWQVGKEEKEEEPPKTGEGEQSLPVTPFANIEPTVYQLPFRRLEFSARTTSYRELRYGGGSRGSGRG